MKFDVIVANPPYSYKKVDKGKPRVLWTHFVEKSLATIKKDIGYLGMIHPPNWRDTGGQYVKIQKRMKQIDIYYLSIYNGKDTIDTFNAHTRFDLYVAKNSYSSDIETEIFDEEKQVTKNNIKKLPYISNFDIDFSQKLLGEDKVEILMSGTFYKHGITQKEKTDEYHLPCVYSISKVDGKLNIRYAKEDKGFFGVSKLLFGIWHSIDIPYIDDKGEYGMCQDVIGIVGDKDYLEKTKKAMLSDKFKRFMRSVQFNTRVRNHKVMLQFKKDFWKEFV